MNSVVIVSAGRGSRMKADINKQFLKLKGKEVIAHTIDKYGYKNIKIAFGGKERQDSVFNGLKAVNERCDIVLIHDGARPFVTDEIIKNSIECAKKNKCVIVGVPVKDTIKIINKDNEVCDTPNRSTLWSIQTPQVFEYLSIIKAHKIAKEKSYYGTDDSMLMEYLGYNVKVIEGSYNNIKITTPEDLKIGEEILNENKKEIN